jgi:hypothetical protein
VAWELDEIRQLRAMIVAGIKTALYIAYCERLTTSGAERRPTPVQTRNERQNEAMASVRAKPLQCQTKAMTRVRTNEAMTASVHAF